MSFIPPRPKTTPRKSITSSQQHRLQATPSQIANVQKRRRAVQIIFRELYNAARFRKWSFTMHGWTKWKDLCNFQRLQEVWTQMEERKKIASINVSLIAEVQELCGANEAKIFLHDKESGMLFAQHDPDANPVITMVGGRGIVGHVAKTKVSIRLKRCKQQQQQQQQQQQPGSSTKNNMSNKDFIPFVVSGKIPAINIFDAEIDSSIGGIEATKNACIVPILSGEKEDSLETRELIGVCQVINRFDGNFDDDVVELLNDFVIFARDEVLEKENQGDVRSLLKAAEKWKVDKKNSFNDTKAYFTYMNDALMREARELVAADRSTLFLVDNVTQELWAKVIDGMAPIRLKIGAGIVGASAKLENVVNIPDAYQDERFSSAFDTMSGYQTRSILCVPIFLREKMVEDFSEIVDVRLQEEEEEEERKRKRRRRGRRGRQRKRKRKTLLNEVL